MLVFSWQVREWCANLCQRHIYLGKEAKKISTIGKESSRKNGEGSKWEWRKRYKPRDGNDLVCECVWTDVKKLGMLYTLCLTVATHGSDGSEKFET